MPISLSRSRDTARNFKMKPVNSVGFWRQAFQNQPNADLKVQKSDREQRQPFEIVCISKIYNCVGRSTN